MKNLKFKYVTAVLASLAFAETTHAQTWDWTKSFGGKEVDYVSGITNDAAGNIYMVGNFKGTASFGSKSLTSKGYYDIFLAKYSPEGQLVWIQQEGGSDLDEGNGIVLDKNGNIYITGYFTSEADFGGIKMKSSGDRDFFLRSLIITER